jgi:transglutaminase-like putative cysteine protease
MNNTFSKLLQRIQSVDVTNLWLLSGLLLAFIPHLTHLPATIVLFSIFLLGWRLCFELRFFQLPNRLVRMVLTLTALIITFIEFHTLFGRQAGVGLLVVMLCLKLLEMKSDRDTVVAIGLGYFVVITVFFFNQSILIGLYMLIVVILLTTALTAHSRGGVKTLRSQNLKLACTMLLQAAPLMLLLFVLFPRIPGPLWNMPSDTIGGTTGLSDSMSPGNISQLSNNDAVAFRVQFKDSIPPQHQRYWRGPVFTYFDGRTWSNSSEVNYEQINQPENKSMSYRTIGKPVNYTVTLEPNNQNWLFALEMLSALPPNSDLSPYYEVISRQPVQQLTRYSIQSYPEYQLDPDIKPNLARYLQLPSKPTKRIKELIQKWRNEATSGHEGIVNRALQNFREQAFYYTRNPPLLLNDPVDEFLFESRRGFCEHYASSFVYLMRAAGIPARVVTGYLGGESNPVSNYFIVRQSSAHAWSEVWLKERGWVRFDPTSMIPPSRVENVQDLQRIKPGIAVETPDWVTSVWQKMAYRWDNLNHFWNQWVLNYNVKRQRDFLGDLLSWLGFDYIDWRGMVTLLFSGMLLVFGVIALRLLRKDPEKRDPAVIAYEQFCRKLAKRGIMRDPAEGFTNFSHRARLQNPQLGPVIAKITSLYQRLRNAPHPPADGLKRLQLAIRQFPH